MNKTHTQLAIARALLQTPSDRHWGYDLLKQTGIKSGVLYPILRRMLAKGWLDESWEERGYENRPPRRYYVLTDEGTHALQELLDR